MGMRSDGPSLFLPTAKKPFDFVPKTVGGTPVLHSLDEVWPCREREAIESVPVAQALREESTHGRPRALREEFVMSTQVSSHHLVKQGLRAATLHTPH
jgi:hypothetical protein